MKEFIEIPATKRSLASRRPVYGVGVNDADYMVFNVIGKIQVTCPYYMVWACMLNRCYSDKLKSRRPTYKGCTVCDEWFLFSVFKGWMEKQDWKGKQLDKDLLIQGNKVYSPNTCMFVDGYINSLFSMVTEKNGKYKLGVSMDKGRYIALCNTKEGLKQVGRFDLETEAHEAYKKFKYQIIKDIADSQSEPLKSALLDYDIDYTGD